MKLAYQFSNILTKLVKFHLKALPILAVHDKKIQKCPELTIFAYSALHCRGRAKREYLEKIKLLLAVNTTLVNIFDLL